MRTALLLLLSSLVATPAAAAKFLCITSDGSSHVTSDPSGCKTMIALPEEQIGASSSPPLKSSDSEHSTTQLTPSRRDHHPEAGGVTQPTKIVCNKFKLVSKLTGNTLHLAVDTDLPDSTEVMVRVSRTYIEKGSKETYSVDYLNEKSTVGKWKSNHTVSIDSTTWKRLLREKQELMSRLGSGFDVASISDKIGVAMVVPVNQADPRFGKWNSQLAGNAVSTSGLRVVKDEVEIPYPLDSPPVGQSPFPNLNPLELENNQTYIVSKRTPLMPSPNPPNPLAALKQMKYIPAGGSFEVLDKWGKKGGPWYRVRASYASGGVIGAGWINSAALLGQKLKAHG